MDSDGDRLGFETLVSQLIEFLMTLVGNKRFVDLMRQAVPRLIYITLGVSARHALDTNQVLSERKTWLLAPIHCWTPVLCAIGLLTASCHCEAVTASYCWATACAFSGTLHKAEWPAGFMQQHSRL